MLFSTEFDVEIAREREEDSIKKDNPLLYTQKDLDAIIEEQKEIAFQKGFSEGVESGKQEMNQSLLKDSYVSLESLRPVIADLLVSVDEYKTALTSETIEILESFVQKILPSLVVETYADKLKDIVSENIQKLSSDKWIEICLSTPVCEFLYDDIDTIIKDSGFRGEYKILGRSQYGQSEVSVHWESGSLKFDVEKVSNEMLAIVNEAKSQLLGEKNG